MDNSFMEINIIRKLEGDRFYEINLPVMLNNHLPVGRMTTSSMENHINNNNNPNPLFKTSL